MDEAEVMKIMSGHDPFATVMVSTAVRTCALLKLCWCGLLVHEKYPSFPMGVKGLRMVGPYVELFLQRP